MVPQNSWHRVFRASVADIAAAADWIQSIAEDLDLPASQGFAMQVCLEELMGNIVRHGGDQLSPGAHWSQIHGSDKLSISIVVNASAERVTMTIEDNGPPFDITEAAGNSIDRPLHQIEPGGLGIQLIRSFANNLEYRRTGQGNCVIAEFTS